ncbi:MAG: hypothetical protein LBP20_00875 [Treponema sp.]|jgi:hypothetical protein|nr:hypothetical protein [Treponema sp.]
MPSQILHVLFGDDVITGIYRSIGARFGLAADRALETIRKDYRTAFALGCQGPDIFYHSQRMRPVGLEYGTLLHRRGAGLFTAGLLQLCLPGPPPGKNAILTGERGINALGVYALGFMTHAVLDREAHPYIIYKSEPPASESPSRGTDRLSRNGSQYHAFFERIIDALMLRKLRGEEAASWDQEAVLARICGEPPPGLKELLVRALVLAFPERAGKDEKLKRRVDNTFADCARFYRLTSPRRTSVGAQGDSVDGGEGEAVDLRTLVYVYPERLPAGIDFLNEKKAPWYYPVGTGGEDCRSFPEIYAGAVNKAAAAIAPVIAAYLETGIFPVREAAQAIGNGGLSIHDSEGRPCAATRSAPLPLDRVLRQQAELRGL